MWERSKPVDLPVRYGPYEVKRALDDNEMKEAIRHLVQEFRQLCLYYGKHAITTSRIGRDEIEEQLHQLSAKYYFRDSKSVRQFLTDHRSLIPMLFEIRQKFDHYFGSESLSDLEVFTDPEDDGHSQKLFALVLTKLPPRAAVPRLDQLDRDWWLRQPYEVRSAMNIDLKYI
jgi:hypothetical protein